MEMQLALALRNEQRVLLQLNGTATATQEAVCWAWHGRLHQVQLTQLAMAWAVSTDTTTKPTSPALHARVCWCSMSLP